ncbi:MAG TPA: hypothetical protein VFB12_02345 [Ktedonobacteraceae bacterium]|nr:hypothetical protein [Ktedonobacteraceae bacterium]
MGASIIHAHDLPEQISLSSLMGRCAVQQVARSIHKSGGKTRNGSLQVLYAARIGHCRACSLREQCQESATTIKARRVSAVYWLLPSCSSVSSGSSPASEEPSPPPAPHPVLWRDWQRRGSLGGS